MSGFIPNNFLVSSENTHSLSNNSDMSGFIPNTFWSGKQQKYTFIK